jgi:phospholipase C
MPQLTRRHFLGGATAAAGFTLLPPSLKRVLAAPAAPLRSLEQIEHVVMLIQENRSFDHYFGSLSGVRGFSDPTAMRLSTGRSVFYQPDALNPDGFELPFHLDTSKTNAAAVADLSHEWSAQHQAWNGGKMDNWLPAHRASDGGNGPLTMGHYMRQDLPFHYALADAFTVCDGYHCSVLGPTHPNLICALTGTNDPDGTGGGPVVNNSWPQQGSFTFTTYPERLLAAGVNWRSYQTDPTTAIQFMFKQFNQAPKTSQIYQAGLQARPITAFMDDVRSGNVPQVSWLHSNADEHPSGHPANGALFMYDVLEALASRPDIWAKTVMFITYDENDGFFDHVPPPTSPPGTPGEWITTPLPPAAAGIAGPTGLGFRVPMLVISPWSRGGWVCSETFDHTSIIRFMERRFGVTEPNISAWRRSTCGDLTSALRLDEADNAFPPLPDPGPMVTLENQEVALPAPAVPSAQTPPAQEPAGAQLVGLTVQVVPGQLGLGQQGTVTAVLSNGSEQDNVDGGKGKGGSDVLRMRPVKPVMLTNLALALRLPPGWSAQAQTATAFPRLAPGHSAHVAWKLTAPAQAANAGMLPSVAATYAIGAYTGSQLDLVPLAAIPLPLSAAFNNIGISDDSNPRGANFDGGGSSYSEQGLTAAGLAPGATVTAAGIQYAMPNVPPGSPDNLQAGSQTLTVATPAGATMLSFLGSAAQADASVPLAIAYTDGSTQTATLGFGDWTLAGGKEVPQFGNVIAATTPYRNLQGGPQAVNAYLFASAPIQLTPGKTIATLSFPGPVSGGQVHVFAIGTDQGPAS